MKVYFSEREGTRMQKNADRSRVLNELFRVSKMGMEASEIILPRTHGRGLSAHIKHQDETYINLMEKSRALLKHQGEEPHSVKKSVQNMLRGAIQADTMFRREPQHIAEMMVRGAAMGIVGVTKVLNHAPDCDAKTRKMAEEYVAAEERNIDRLKGYL